MALIKIISGGQTGADLGALIGAQKIGLKTGGTAPPGWWSGGKNQRELLQRFGLVEGEPDEKIYPKRSMKNVDDADGTVAILLGNSIGTMKTIGYCQNHKWSYPVYEARDYYKPHLIISNLNISSNAYLLDRFVDYNNIKILNVAGHRESSFPGIQIFTSELIKSFYERTRQRIAR